MVTRTIKHAIATLIKDRIFVLCLNVIGSLRRWYLYQYSRHLTLIEPEICEYSYKSSLDEYEVRFSSRIKVFYLITCIQRDMECAFTVMSNTCSIRFRVLGLIALLGFLEYYSVVTYVNC